MVTWHISMWHWKKSFKLSNFFSIQKIKKLNQIDYVLPLASLVCEVIPSQFPCQLFPLSTGNRKKKVTTLKEFLQKQSQMGRRGEIYSSVSSKSDHIWTIIQNISMLLWNYKPKIKIWKICSSVLCKFNKYQTNLII